MTELNRLLDGKRLLIFDFDGTVADTSPLHASAFSAVLAPLGIEVDYSAIAGRKTADAIRDCLLAAGVHASEAEMAALASAKQDAVRALIRQSLAPLPGVDDFLRWARPRFQIAMASSGSRGTVGLALERLGYVGWFDPLVCADDVDRAKPHPDMFLKVLEMTGIRQEDALVFEDSAAGFAAAAAAGLGCVDARRDLWAQLNGRTA